MNARPAERLEASAPALLGLLAVVILLFPSSLRGFTVSSGDVQLMFLGQNETLLHCLARGSWPVWDPFLGFGQPFLANPGNQVLYPPSWLNLLLPPEASLTLYVLGHAFWAGLGTYVLARRELRLSRFSAWLSAAAWMSSGALVSHVQRWQHFASISWLPWLLLAALACARRPAVPRVLALGAVLALQWLAGSLEMAAASLLLAVAWTLATGVASDRRQLVARLLATWLPAGLLALGLTAAQWLPALELLRHSARSEAVGAKNLWWSVHPLRWLELVAPLRPDEMLLSEPLHAELLGEAGSTIVPSLYAGIVLSALALFAVGYGPRRRGALALATVALVAAILAMGPRGHLLPWLIAHVPALAVVRFPGKLTLLVSFACALLAGLGLEAWSEARSRGQGRALAPWILAMALPAAAFVLVVLAAPALLVGTVVPPPPPGARVFDAVSLDVWMCGGAVAVAAVAAAVAWSRRLPGRGALAALALLAVADPLPPNHRVTVMVPARLVGTAPETARVLRQLGAGRVHSLEENRPDGPDGPERWQPDPRTPLPEQQALALGMNLALYGRSAGRWGLEGSYTLESLVVPTVPQYRLSTLFHLAYRRPAMLRMLQAGGVTHVVGRTRQLEGLAPVADVSSPLMAPIRVFAVPDPLPRTFVVGAAAAAASDDDALRCLLDPGVDLRRGVCLSGGPARPAAPGFAGTSHVLRAIPDEVALETVASHEGYAVLLDGYDPGWTATVDGVPADVRRANFAFRAVAVPAGRHLVELRYRPRSVIVGIALSAAALATGLGLAAARLRRAAQ